MNSTERNEKCGSELSQGKHGIYTLFKQVLYMYMKHVRCWSGDLKINCLSVFPLVCISPIYHDLVHRSFSDLRFL